MDCTGLELKDADEEIVRTSHAPPMKARNANGLKYQRLVIGEIVQLPRSPRLVKVAIVSVKPSGTRVRLMSFPDR